MEKVILVRYGEIILKGLNRPVFENKLMSNIKKALSGMGRIKVFRSQARIYIEPLEDGYDFDEALNRLTKVFGIVSVSPVWKVSSDFNVINEHALMLVGELMRKNPHRTFKVETKRGNKRFPLDSPQVSSEIGGSILQAHPELQVALKEPDFVLYIEVRESTYLYSEKIQANGGMPVGTNGKALLLLSGGIDSPVAGWMIAKRGVEIEAIHFYSYPYTSERAKEKVVDLAKIMAGHTGPIKLHVVPFTEIQLKINEECPEELSTIIMRRQMMKISEAVALKIGAQALVTGESIGQVASQTIQSLAVTNAAVSIPVFRPLVGMDKVEVIQIARRIDTFETSILPYEDCCTVFTPKHPNTRPKMGKVLEVESSIDFSDSIQKAIENIEVIPLPE